MKAVRLGHYFKIVDDEDLKDIQLQKTHDEVRYNGADVPLYIAHNKKDEQILQKIEGSLLNIDYYKLNTCCICKRSYTGYGNNAIPLGVGRCCDECDMLVILARIQQTVKDK